MSKKTTKKVMLKDRDVGAKKSKEIKGAHSGGVNVAMADGSVRFVSPLNFQPSKKQITDGTSN